MSFLDHNETPNTNIYTMFSVMFYKIIFILHGEECFKSVLLIFRIVIYI